MNQIYSQTQLANIASFSGLIVILLGQMGIVVGKDQTAFILSSIWTLGWQAYSFYQRYQKGDLTLGGFRKT